MDMDVFSHPKKKKEKKMDYLFIYLFIYFCAPIRYLVCMQAIKVTLHKYFILFFKNIIQKISFLPR
jgi:hypothetical protein